MNSERIEVMTEIGESDSIRKLMRSFVEASAAHAIRIVKYLHDRNYIESF